MTTSQLLPLTICLVVFSSCGDARRDASDAEKSSRKPRVPLTELKVEIRSDGLSYLPGATQPFTGDAIELHSDRIPPPLAKRTPYVNGRKHGVVTTHTSGGKLREERSYVHGRPVSSMVYHGNGQKKIEVRLNEKDLAEGPYKRWHDNGALQAESTFDSEERFHGEEKDYDREGKLVGHYRSVHGQLVEIVFETPEMKSERLAKMAPAPLEGGGTPTPPVKP